MEKELKRLLRTGACFKYDNDNANYLDKLIQEVKDSGGRLKINTKPYLDKVLSKCKELGYFPYNYNAKYIKLLNLIPTNGIYIIQDVFENNRVVYVGINEEGKLPERLANHFDGKGKSALRRHIMECGLDKDQATKYIQEHFTFKIVSIEERENRERLESMLISTFNLDENNTPTDNWLGKKSPKQKISKGKLWNIQCLNKECINEWGLDIVFDKIIFDTDLFDIIIDYFG